MIVDRRFRIGGSGSYLVYARVPNDRGFSLGRRRAARQVSRSGKANIEDEVSEPQIQGSAAGPVDDECEQDDDQDDDHQPEEEHNDRGDCVPAYGSGSDHGPQLPRAARIIRTGRYR